MRRLLAPLLAVAMTLGLLSAAPLTASAAPPTAPWAGSAGGATARVGASLANGTLDLVDLGLATSQAGASSATTPRSTGRSANLDATAADALGVSAQADQANAGPAPGSDTDGGTLASVSALGVGVKALTSADQATWNGDNACVVAGVLASARTATAGTGTTDGVSLNLLGIPLLSTGASTTTGTTSLVRNGSSGSNYGVQGTATGTIANVVVAGTRIGISGTPTLVGTATGNGAPTYVYTPGTVTITPAGGSTRTIALGATDRTTINLALATIALAVTVNERPNPTADGVSFPVVSISLDATVPIVGTDLLSADIDLLPLNANAQAPVGGIDCPTAAPVLTTPANGSSSEDQTPTYSGTGVAGAAINLTVDGVPQAAVTTVDGDGTWSFTPTTPLAPGSHTVFATQSLNGAESAASGTNTFTVLADTTAPDAPVITAPPSPTVNPRPPIRGTVAADVTSVRVFLDDAAGKPVLVGTDTDTSDGTFSVTPTTPLVDATYTATAVAADAAGNDSVPSADYTFVVDTTAPAAPVVNAPLSPTTDSTPAIGGTVAADVTSVRVFLDDAAGNPVLVGTDTNITGGTFSVVPLGELANGTYTATAVALDAAGNESVPSADYVFVVNAPDETAPDAPVITVPVDGATVTTATPTISGTAEAGSSVVVTIGTTVLPAVTADGDGNFSVVAPPLANGDYTATAVATDVAGNVSDVSDEVDFTAAVPDTTAPAAPVVNTPLSPTTDATPPIGGTTEPGTSVEVFLDFLGDAAGPFSIGTDTTTAGGVFSVTPGAALVSGDYVATAVATDAAGNDSVVSVGYPFTVAVTDTTAPAAPVITGPVGGTTVTDSTPPIIGTAEPGSTVVVTVNGTPLPPVTATPGGTFAVTPTTPLPEGPNTVTAVATDPAGNPSPVSAPVAFVVDTTAPAVTITVPTDGQRFRDFTPTFKGTADVGSTVTLFLDGGELVDNVPVSAGGTWEYTPTTALTSGAYMLRATATDAAGNESPQTDESDFVIVTPPVIIVPAEGEVVDPTPTIGGTGTPGANIRVVSVGSNPTARAFVDGETVGTANVDLNGNWSFDVTVPLDYGTYRVQAQQRFADEAAGAPLDADFDLSNVVTFVVAPAPPVITTPVGGDTMDTPTDICGTGQAGSTVVLTDEDGTVLGQATVDQDGDFCVTVTFDDGDHTVTATQTTEGQADQVSEPVDFTVDAGSGGDDGNGSNGNGNNGNGSNGNGNNGNGSNGNGNGNGNGLANTGGPSLLIGLAALLLLGAGSATVVVSRRRRRG